jgi:hypothetical protein
MARGDVALLKPGLGQVGGSVYVVPAVSRHARLSAPDELSAMAAAAARTALATARVASEVSVSLDMAGLA